MDLLDWDYCFNDARWIAILVTVSEIRMVVVEVGDFFGGWGFCLLL